MKAILKKTTKNYICFVSCQNESQAEVIATNVVNKNLAKCANIVKSVNSIYKWEGKLVNDKEVLLILKGNTKNQRKLVSEIRSLHSYDVPEIIFTKIDSGSTDYINWLNRDK